MRGFITILTAVLAPALVAAHTIIDSTPAGEPHGWPLQAILIVAAAIIAALWLLFWLRRP